MTTTAAMSATSGNTGYTQTTSPTGYDQLGKDQFMLLLLTQLRNQDPLQPMEDKEFISELAQFNSLEQMQQMNQGLTALMYMNIFSQASAMIGRTVDGLDASGNEVSGTVSAVTFEKGVAQLQVGDATIELGNVTKVR